MHVIATGNYNRIAFKVATLPYDGLDSESWLTKFDSSSSKNLCDCISCAQVLGPSEIHRRMQVYEMLISWCNQAPLSPGLPLVRNWQFPSLTWIATHGGGQKYQLMWHSLLILFYETLRLRLLSSIQMKLRVNLKEKMANYLINFSSTINNGLKTGPQLCLAIATWKCCIN